MGGIAIGGAWVMVQNNKTEIARVETESENADDKLKEELKEKCREIEEHINNLRIAREMRTKDLETNLLELNRQFNMCLNDCPKRRKSDMDSILKHLYHTESQEPRFVPQIAFEKHKDESDNKFEKMGVGVDRQYSEIMQQLNTLIRIISEKIR